MKQSRYNQILEHFFDRHGKKIIRIGDPLTQQAWDLLIDCANNAAGQYAIECTNDALIRAAQNKVLNNQTIIGTEIILK